MTAPTLIQAVYTCDEESRTLAVPVEGSTSANYPTLVRAIQNAQAQINTYLTSRMEKEGLPTDELDLDSQAEEDEDEPDVEAGMVAPREAKRSKATL
ncbi:hypothetical protein IWQ60_003256 [Tieghemiomyces parasiticus]|uniref:EKC/KEOPS complex subunit GON7 n=1 Tax=Tieghemiomyces parasiticus TaxID=78921 RepID=A0A9W8AAP3_9FUNG|nr:hypothetical protein IWQ60_003256 [Tieghemiomyces parasiticus]